MVGAGVSGSINLAKSSINSNYQSVGEQSAIRAGDGGFQVEVKGNTTLTGAQITSTQAAIDNNKNSFQTGGTLTTHGGRVLCVTGLGDSVRVAQARAHAVIDGIRFDGMQYRRDIGHRALSRRPGPAKRG